MRPVCLPPPTQGKQIPGDGDSSNRGKECIEGPFHHLTRANVKTVYQDVGPAREQEDCNNGDSNGNAFFLVLMKGAAAEPIVVFFGHDWTMLKNRNVPMTSARTMGRRSKIGFTRRRPCSSRGFRGSFT